MRTRRAVCLLPLSLVLLAASAHAHGGFVPPPPTPPEPPPEKPGAGPTGVPASGPSGPARPASPTTGPTAPAGPGYAAGQPVGPTTFGGGMGEPDLTVWNLWWDLNKAPYLDLKAHVYSPGPVTGVDGFLGEPNSLESLKPTEEQVRAGVVPAFLKVLEKEQDHDLVSGTLVALAKVGLRRDAAAGSGEEARRFEAAIARFLVDDNQEIRETAAVSLGILASPTSIPTLANLLWDTAAGRKLVQKGEVDYRTRAFAAYGLGLVGARTASEADRQVIVAALTRALERDKTATPDVSVACLIAFSIVPLATLGEPRENAHPAPPESSRLAQLEYLIALLADEERDERVRAQCPVALARLLAGIPPERREPLRARVAEALSDRLERNRELPNVQQSCVLALGEIGTNDGAQLDARIRSALTGAFQQASENQLRGFALIAIARVGGRAGASSTSGLDPATDFLLGQLAEGKSMSRAWAGLACGILGHELVDVRPAPAALERLRRAVRSVLEDEKDPSKLGAYAIAAGLLRDRESAPLLLARIAKALPEDARGHVATGLALLGHEEARELVRRIVSESSFRPLLLRESAIALAVLEDKEAAPLLVRMLEQASSMAAQTALSTALGYAGDRRAVEPLLAKLFDTERSERARGYASVALGNICDKETLPWNSKIALGLNYRAATSTLTDPVRGGGMLDIF